MINEIIINIEYFTSELLNFFFNFSNEKKNSLDDRNDGFTILRKSLTYSFKFEDNDCR